MGDFLCGIEMVKPYVNAHLHCIVSSLKWASKMSILPINGKISVNAYACVVYVYNVTSALYCAINNHFCVIRVSFVATSQLACRWMCDSPGTVCAWRLTPTYIWREPAKAKAHTICNICEFLGNNYCIPKRWPMGPPQQSWLAWLKPLVTPLVGDTERNKHRQSISIYRSGSQTFSHHVPFVSPVLSPRTTLLQENSINQILFDLKFGKPELTQMWHEDNGCGKL